MLRKKAPKANSPPREVIFLLGGFQFGNETKKTNNSIFFAEDVRILCVDVSFLGSFKEEEDFFLRCEGIFGLTTHLMKPSPWVPQRKL